MLVLYIFLLSCCFSHSMGSAIKEFRANLETVADLAGEEIFLPAPVGKFQCNCVPCQLEKTVEYLKDHFRNDQMRPYISRMEKNMGCIISALDTAHTKSEKDGPCPISELNPQRALQKYTKFFEKLRENC